MKKLESLHGKRFGRWTVVELVGTCSQGRRWRCVCDCGNESIVLTKSLCSGWSRSCGCLKADVARITKTVHGLNRHPLAQAWRNMVSRCHKPSDISYSRYGARGISVCDEWRNSIIAFYNWAIGNGWQEGLSIDRIDNDGNYEPSNCRWATYFQQAANTRRSRPITINGRTQALRAWCRECGVPSGTVYKRLKRGLTVEQSLGIVD